MYLFAELRLWFLLICLSLAEANSTHSARMIFTSTETTTKRFPSPVKAVWIFPQEEPESVTMAAGKQLISFNFESPLMVPVRKNVSWGESADSQTGSDWNIVLVHKMKTDDQIFVCIICKETVCCEMNLSAPSPGCTSSKRTQDIQDGIKYFTPEEGGPSALDESGESTDLYITYSGSGSMYKGIYRFGKNRVVPANQNKEQHYVGVVLNRREDTLQNRVYAFYREKNSDTGMYGEMWLPFVTQVCMSDVGGPKGNMQFTWTSQMSARLYCGDPDSKQHFSELVDMATVHSKQWQDTRIFALFRNEWGMSAVCVYTIRDINQIFQTSPIKGGQSMSRKCVEDSTKIYHKATEMENWILPMNGLGPLIINHHKYTHIQVDIFAQKWNHPVLFLSLNNGAVHKVVQTGNQSIVIAEYHPFTPRGDIHSIILHPSSRKLYVNSRDELVQLDVANCSQYGDTCGECVLARDPYCGWAKTQCTHYKDGMVQDVAKGDHNLCGPDNKSRMQALRYSRSSTELFAREGADSVTLPPHSKYFLKCPITSQHAQYTWTHGSATTLCSSKEKECLQLIDSMGSENEGEYKCESTENGYRQVLAQYQLKLGNSAVSLSPRPLVGVGLLAVLLFLLNTNP